MRFLTRDIKKQLKLNPNWPEAQNIIAILQQKGFQTVVAGGTIRDALLNNKPKDIDLATSAKSKEILEIFPSAKGAFKKYGVVFIPLKNKETLEIVSFRKDHIYRDGRRPDSISYSSIKEDAKRRDFTINALFYDCYTEEIIDFVEGLKDIKNKTLRTVGLPNKRFKEDYLRVLRALRFAHQLEFSIHKDTKQAISVFAPYIKNISRERIQKELVNMLSFGRIGEALKSLKEYHLFSYIFPKIADDLKSNHLNNPYIFWNQNFSFCKNQAFVWTVVGLPYFYPNKDEFHIFLKELLLSSPTIKQSLSYLKAVEILTTPQSPLIDRLKALEGQAKSVFELTSCWLKSKNLSTTLLNKTLKDFKSRSQQGKLPEPLVKGSDLLKVSPPIAKKQFSSILKQAFAYQMEHPTALKSDVLKHILTLI